MAQHGELRVVQLTPPGRGAVATLLIEGPGAAEAVEAGFRAYGGRTLRSGPGDRPAVGRFGPGTGEEVVVRCRSEDAAELHCHGGLAAVAMVEKTLVKLGCRAGRWRDHLAEHRQDPIAAAAHVALAEARTTRTAAILLDQYQGALRRAVGQIEAAIQSGDTADAAGRIEELLARADLGRHLVRPWRVVLAGRANVGKSSLINAVMGYPRAIVHPTPGTTRDVVTANTAVDGWPIELADTAGLGGGGDALQRAGIELARRELADADLVVLVFDAGTPWSRRDEALRQSQPGALVAHNKSDLPRPPAPRPPGLLVSALTAAGIESLVRAIADHLVPNPPPAGAAVAFTAEQLEHVHRLRDSLAGRGG